MSVPAQSEAILQIAHAATRARRADLQAAFVQQFGWAVQAGPFAGMLLPERAGLSDGDTLPKLLGCYEAELHEVLAPIIESRPGVIVNIGAAKGYYAVGLARALPEAFVHAFDTSPQAGDICREAARLNGVQDRVSVAGTCTPGLLQHLMIRAPNPLLVCDCEGGERELIDPQKVPALAAASMIVECHDFVDPAITGMLVERLSPTHELLGVRESARDPNVHEFLRPFNSLDRWIAVCEYRPCTMHWLIAHPKSVAG